MQTHYTTLGVEPDATDEQIKKAFRRIMRQNHPDIAGDNPEAAKTAADATVAYETLTNNELREDYDAELRGEKLTPEEEAENSFDPTQFEDAWGVEEQWETDPDTYNVDDSEEWGSETSWDEEIIDDELVDDDTHQATPQWNPGDTVYSKPRVKPSTSRYRILKGWALSLLLLPLLTKLGTDVMSPFTAFGNMAYPTLGYITVIAGFFLTRHFALHTLTIPNPTRWAAATVGAILLNISTLFFNNLSTELALKATSCLIVGYLLCEVHNFLNQLKQLSKTVTTNKDLKKFNTFGQLNPGAVEPRLVIDTLDSLRSVPALRFINTPGPYPLILLYGEKIAYVAPLILEETPTKLSWWSGMLVNNTRNRPQPVLPPQWLEASAATGEGLADFFFAPTPDVKKFLITYTPSSTPTLQSDDPTLPTVVSETEALNEIATHLQLHENKPAIDKDTFTALYLSEYSPQT